jgi:hypothetical protein
VVVEEEASMVVADSAVAAFMAVASVVGASAVVAFMAAGLRAESAAAAVELASAERAPHVVFRTLLAQGRDSLQLVIHHPGSLSMMDGPLDPFLPTLRAIMPRWLQQRVHRKHFHNAE